MHPEKQYLGLIKNIINRGIVTPSRNANTLNLIGTMSKYSLQNNTMPILTTKKVAWKTCSSLAFRDAWSIAISKKYILVVWVGNFKGKGNSSFVGRTGAGPLLFSILDAIDTEKNWKVSKLFKTHKI